MTAVRTLLVEAASRLRDAEIPTPRVDAELLLAAALSVSRTRLVTLTDVASDAEQVFHDWVRRRVAREPLQHITGVAPFRYLDLAVGSGVFVPRPETELLVDAVLPHLRGSANPSVVDLCAGSGALALAIAHEMPGARVVALEKSAAAMPWLTANAAGTGVDVVEGDVRDETLLVHLYGSVDAVVSNPPYVPLGVDLEPEVAADPADAVFAGSDGLGLIPAVLDRAARLLRSGGVLAMEHDDTHGDVVPALLISDGRWTSVRAREDLSSRPRYVTAHRR